MPKQVLSIIIVNKSRLGYTLMFNVKVRNFSTSIKLWFYFRFSKGLMLGVRERAASRQVQHMASVTFNGSKPITESIAIVSFFFFFSFKLPNGCAISLGFFHSRSHAFWPLKIEPNVCTKHEIVLVDFLLEDWPNISHRLSVCTTFIIKEWE